MTAELLSPLVSVAGVVVLFAAVGWMVSPVFRVRLRHAVVRLLVVSALLLVAVGLLTGEWGGT